MKKLVLAVALLIIAVFALPLMLINNMENKSGIEDIKSDEGILVNVYDTESGKVFNMDLEEYTLGVLAGEMPASFDIEALKAQALAARTYTLLRMRKFGGKGCEKNPAADVCTNPSHCQAYVNPKTIGKANLNKLKSAVKETKGEVIVYNGQLIDAVFHSTSGGKTENSEDIWTNKIPYLRSVMSQYEDGSPKLITKKEVSVEDFIAAVKAIDNEIKIDKKHLNTQIQILERSEGGRIKKIKIGDKVLDGEEVKLKLGLNSSNFSMNIRGDTIVFTVIGNGHGIGMSQYGADGMAKRGANYKEIIKHYYQGVEIVKIGETGWVMRDR